jgi:hypothetical protein
MTPAAKTIASLVVAVLIVRGATAQNLIPPPDAPQSGYFIEFSDATTMASGPGPGVAPSDWQSAPAASPSAAPAAIPAEMPPTLAAPLETSDDDGGQLWSDACDGVGDPCVGSCGTVCTNTCGLWSHRSSIHASVLYLRPRNLDVAYAVPIDGPVTSSPANSPLQIGGVGVVDHDYQSGFDAGINLAVNPLTSLYAQIMMLDSSTSHSTRTAAPNLLRSMVSHPSSTSAGSDFLAASADLGFQLDTFDLGLRHLFVGGQVYAVNYLVGARYSRLEQSFAATFVDNGTEQVGTDIDFDGGGLSLGLEAERQSCTSGLRLYSRGTASFLAGRFRGRYFQGQSFDPTVVDTDWEAGRVVPVLDLELRAGWSSSGGRLRLSAGYLVSSWFNTVQTADFIRAVQANDFGDLGDGFTLDGLQVEAEWRF